jgi:hypothetical protein
LLYLQSSNPFWLNWILHIDLQCLILTGALFESHTHTHTDTFTRSMSEAKKKGGAGGTKNPSARALCREVLDKCKEFDVNKLFWFPVEGVPEV